MSEDKKPEETPATKGSRGPIYAKTLAGLRTWGVPAPDAVVQLAVQAVRATAKRLAMSEDNALRLVLRQVELAREAGETVNRFWFEDARYETVRKPAAGRKGPQTAEPEVVDPLPERLDAARGDAVWRGMLASAQAKIPRQSFETWLKPLKPLGVGEDGVLYIRIPDPAFRCVGERYGDLFGAVIPEGIEAVRALYLGSRGAAEERTA